MTFQSVVRYDWGFGIPGEIIKDGPKRARPGYILSADATQNIVGRVFTQNTPGAGIPAGSVGAGGTGAFVGILANPKVYASFGTVVNGPLSPTMLLPNNVQAEFLQMGYVVASMSNANVNIGDAVHYVEATGAMLSVAQGTAPAAGNALVPNAIIDELPQTIAAGLVILKLTN